MEIIENLTAIAYSIMGLGVAVLLVTIVFKGNQMLIKGSLIGIVSLVIMGLFIAMFGQGAESREFIETISEQLTNEIEKGREG